MIADFVVDHPEFITALGVMILAWRFDLRDDWAKVILALILVSAGYGIQRADTEYETRHDSVCKMVFHVNDLGSDEDFALKVPDYCDPPLEEARHD